MFHHIAMFRFLDGVEDATIAELRASLLGLPQKIETIRSYKVGRNAKLGTGTWDLVIVAEFDDEDGYHFYSTQPDHINIAKRILELISDRAALQTADLD